MKTAFLRSITLIALFSLVAVSGRADAATHDRIIKERDAVLSEIVAYQEGQFATGTVGDEALTSAQTALRIFRRDTAGTVSEKIKQQELIVQAHEQKLSALKARRTAGIGSRLDILTATDAVLQAKQLLEELKSCEKKN